MDLEELLRSTISDGVPTPEEMQAAYGGRGTRRVAVRLPSAADLGTESSAASPTAGSDSSPEPASPAAPRRGKARRRKPSQSQSRKPRANNKCPHCLKKLDTRYKLERHVRTHTGERPFKCEVCASRFNQKSSLKTHSTIHAREYIHDPATGREALAGHRINGYSLVALGFPHPEFYHDALKRARATEPSAELPPEGPNCGSAGAAGGIS